MRLVDDVKRPTRPGKISGSEGRPAILPCVLPSSVSERLDRLAPDQREAATAPPGPVLCVAPAGSGKTTTLVARIAWLVATGADPARITAVTFNKRAADEMAARVDAALEPLGLPPGSVRVKTFHALGREILADAGERVEPLLDRESVLRDMWPEIDRGAIRRLDDAFSRLKLDIGVTAAQVGEDPEPGPIARAFLGYEGAIADAGGLDFDDLVARALRLLEARPLLLRRWRARCTHLLVDETQDVDRSQLRLALLLAAPENRIFLVGDDDQSFISSLLGTLGVRRSPNVGTLKLTPHQIALLPLASLGKDAVVELATTGPRSLAGCSNPNGLGPVSHPVSNRLGSRPTQVAREHC